MNSKGPHIARWIWGTRGPGRPLRTTLLLLILLPLIAALIALGWAMMHSDLGERRTETLGAGPGNR